MKVNNIVPVIHCKTEKQVFDNIELCIKNMVNMVSLIDHGYLRDPEKELLQLVCNANALYSKHIKVSANFLGSTTNKAITYCKTAGIKDIWIDNDGCKDRSDIRLYGGVAFKYQKSVKKEDLQKVCLKAMTEMDVIVTSGVSTGKSPTIEKIETMRDYIGDFPMAIASGITPENVASFSHLSDYFFVASSITNIDCMILEDRLTKLIQNANL